MWKLWSLPPESPVAADELGAFLRLDIDQTIAEDGFLQRMLSMATEAAEKYLGLAVAPREFTYSGQIRINGYPDLRPIAHSRKAITLPYTNLLEVVSVTVDGEEIQESHYTLFDGDPASILLSVVPRETVEIVYDAGYEYLPASIEQGILMHAAYLYEHRGACDVEASLRQSGAASVYDPHRVPLL